MARRTKNKSKSRTIDGARALEVKNPHACGIDLGSKEHFVCCPSVAGEEREVRIFPTDTPSLNGLADWLGERGVTTVAMESTGVYWIPLYELLSQRGLEVVLVDSRTVSRMSDRKTDPRDSRWLQQLHACGLLRGAFRPGEDAVRFRALERMKSTLVSEAADWLRRIQKELDQMNVRVHRAVSDITGVTGMAILHAIVAGERSPARLAEFRDRRCHASREQIERELSGNWREEHLLNVATALAMYEFINGRIEEIRSQITTLLDSYRVRDGADPSPAPPPPSATKANTMRKRGQHEMRQTLFQFAGVDLTRIDGIAVGTAEVLLSEIGPDLLSFPTEKQFLSYLRLCPGVGISGGKPVRNRKKPTIGSNRSREALRIAAMAAGRTKTAIGAYYRKTAFRKGNGVAVFAVARKLAQYVYRMLRFGTDYVDEGLQRYEEQGRERRFRRLAQNAKELGFSLQPVGQTSTAS